MRIGFAIRLSIMLAAALSAFTVCATTALSQNPPPQATSGEQIFDVRNGDQEGKLLISDAELAFESLTDARHSRRWKYAEIRELSKRKSEFTVRPFKGDRYAFQFKDKKLRDRIFNLISERIIAARRGQR